MFLMNEWVEPKFDNNLTCCAAEGFRHCDWLECSCLTKDNNQPYLCTFVSNLLCISTKHTEVHHIKNGKGYFVDRVEIVNEAPSSKNILIDVLAPLIKTMFKIPQCGCAVHCSVPRPSSLHWNKWKFRSSVNMITFSILKLVRKWTANLCEAKTTQI